MSLFLFAVKTLVPEKLQASWSWQSHISRTALNLKRQTSNMFVSKHTWRTKGRVFLSLRKYSIQDTTTFTISSWNCNRIIRRQKLRVGLKIRYRVILIHYFFERVRRLEKRLAVSRCAVDWRFPLSVKIFLYSIIFLGSWDKYNFHKFVPRVHLMCRTIMVFLKPRLMFDHWYLMSIFWRLGLPEGVPSHSTTFLSPSIYFLWQLIVAICDSEGNCH